MGGLRIQQLLLTSLIFPLSLGLSGCLSVTTSNNNNGNTPLSSKSYQVTVSGDSNETFSFTSQSVSPGATASVTVAVNVGYLLSQTVGGTCPSGTWNGSAYTTGAVNADCTLIFSASANVYLYNLNVAPQTLVPVADVSFAGQANSFDQMYRSGNSIYLTGAPFAYAQLDITTPQSPSVVYNASQNLAQFDPSWALNDYGTNALNVMGSYVFATGASGMTVIDNSTPAQSSVVQTYPGSSYAYNAMINVPSTSLMLGISDQNLDILEVSGPSVVKAFSQPLGATFSINGAAYFNSEVFVAAQDCLITFTIGVDGQVSNSNILSTFPALNVQISDNYLYVEQTGNLVNHQNIPPGIFVLNKLGVPVYYFDISPINFVVSADDQYLYANLNNQSLWAYKTGLPQ